MNSPLSNRTRQTEEQRENIYRRERNRTVDRDFDEKNLLPPSLFLCFKVKIQTSAFGGSTLGSSDMMAVIRANGEKVRSSQSKNDAW